MRIPWNKPRARRARAALRALFEGEGDSTDADIAWAWLAEECADKRISVRGMDPFAYYRESAWVESRVALFAELQAAIEGSRRESEEMVKGAERALGAITEGVRE